MRECVERVYVTRVLYPPAKVLSTHKSKSTPVDTWVSFRTGTLAPITNSRRTRSVISEDVVENIVEGVLL